MKILRRALPSLTLLEWGAILTYFYFSGRIASFLHPMFRPWVLVTGVLLVITAVCVGLFPEEGCEHEHDHEGGEEHEHAHDRLTFGGAIAFLLLLVPFALAAKVSPDSYGADLIQSRGLVEDIRALPGIRSHPNLPSQTQPAATPTLAAQSAQLRQSIAQAGAALGKNPQQSVDKALEQAAQETLVEPELPTQNGAPEDAPPTPSPNDPAYQNEFLKPDQSGNIKVQVTDLLYAAQEPGTRKDFEGKRVEILGQFLKPKKGAPEQNLAPNAFMLVRLVMVCCAADMMPAAVKIEQPAKAQNFRPTSWLKVVGRVHYQPRPKGPSPDGIDYGDTPEPVIVAEKISKTPTPAEKYIY